LTGVQEEAACRFRPLEIDEPEAGTPEVFRITEDETVGWSNENAWSEDVTVCTQGIWMEYDDEEEYEAEVEDEKGKLGAVPADELLASLAIILDVTWKQCAWMRGKNTLKKSMWAVFVVRLFASVPSVDLTTLVSPATPISMIFVWRSRTMWTTEGMKRARRKGGSVKGSALSKVAIYFFWALGKIRPGTDSKIRTAS